jgi:hypothetical protein
MYVCMYILPTRNATLRDDRKDTPDYAYDTHEYIHIHTHTHIQAFKQGTFSKISELIKFETRLMNSMQLAASRADWATLSILENSDTAADLKAFLTSMGGVASTLVTTDEVCVGYVCMCMCMYVMCVLYVYVYENSVTAADFEGYIHTYIHTYRVQLSFATIVI